jgi:transcription initiation factor TFIID subunit 6
MKQPPHKKIATEGTMGVIPMNSMQTGGQGAAGGYSIAVGGSNVGLSSLSRLLPTENMSGREVGGRVAKTSTVVSQAWKENMDAGHLLASSFEFFGESLYSFAPKPKLSFFL